MANSVRQGTLPDKPQWVSINATDAHPSRRPTNTTTVPYSDGKLNSMDPVPIQASVAIKWRVVIGNKLAKMLNYPDLGMMQRSFNHYDIKS